MRNRMLRLAAPATLLLLAAGCGEDKGSSKAAEVKLEAKSGSTVSGTLKVLQTGGGVVIDGKIEGLSPGKHGFHIHQNGDCSASDASSAGGHYAPDDNKHGGPKSDEHHAGDLGNIEADQKGVANVQKRPNWLTLIDDRNPIAGKSIVVHSGEDDLESQPSGAAGKRVACGVITTSQ